MSVYNKNGQTHCHLDSGGMGGLVRPRFTANPWRILARASAPARSVKVATATIVVDALTPSVLADRQRRDAVVLNNDGDGPTTELLTSFRGTRPNTGIKPEFVAGQSSESGDREVGGDGTLRSKNSAPRT